MFLDFGFSGFGSLKGIFCDVFVVFGFLKIFGGVFGFGVLVDLDWKTS